MLCRVELAWRTTRTSTMMTTRTSNLVWAFYRARHSSHLYCSSSCSGADASHTLRTTHDNEANTQVIIAQCPCVVALFGLSALLMVFQSGLLFMCVCVSVFECANTWCLMSCSPTPIFYTCSRTLGGRCEHTRTRMPNYLRKRSTVR